AGAQHLSFRSRGECYAIPIQLVREILEYGQITFVPMMPEFIRGVINLRGNVVPVLDLCARFDYGLTPITKRTCIVILEVPLSGHPQLIGLIVESVDAVLDIEADTIEVSPKFGAGIHTDFIRGMARREQGFIIILNVEKVLAMEELQHLTN